MECDAWVTPASGTLLEGECKKWNSSVLVDELGRAGNGAGEVS